MVTVFVLFFTVFYIFPEFQQHVRKSVGTYHGHAVALLLHDGAEINAYFENQFRQAQLTLWQMVKKNLDRFFTMWHSKER